MQVSLIVTTYERKEALAACLRSAFGQVHLPEEIVVADDGSGPDTRATIERLRAEAPVPLLHAWQEHRGFRVAAARNRAIAAASGQYVVLVDGDMLMERHFVLDHRAAARPGFFMQGGRVSIGPVLTRAILAGGHPPKIHVLMRGIGNRKNAVRSAVLSWLFSAESRSPRKARACNVAFWRSDAVAVNGFNEDFVGWGLEDNEFFARLLNRGLRRRNLRHRAIAYHLDHLRDARDRVDRNQRLFDQTARTGASWCAMGLDQYLDDASGPDIGTDILPLRARRRAA